jgi:hypothetical protein
MVLLVILILARMVLRSDARYAEAWLKWLGFRIRKGDADDRSAGGKADKDVGEPGG